MALLECINSIYSIIDSFRFSNNSFWLSYFDWTNVPLCRSLKVFSSLVCNVATSSAKKTQLHVEPSYIIFLFGVRHSLLATIYKNKNIVTLGCCRSWTHIYKPASAEHTQTTASEEIATAKYNQLKCSNFIECLWHIVVYSLYIERFRKNWPQPRKKNNINFNYLLWRWYKKWVKKRKTREIERKRERDYVCVSIYQQTPNKHSIIYTLSA